MTEPHWVLRLTCIVFGVLFLSALQQIGPWGHSLALGVGAIGIGNALATDITRWLRRQS